MAMSELKGSLPPGFFTRHTVTALRAQRADPAAAAGLILKAVP
jgi:hypothetical protein